MSSAWTKIDGELTEPSRLFLLEGERRVVYHCRALLSQQLSPDLRTRLTSLQAASETRLHTLNGRSKSVDGPQ
jgi:hypothetical protein